MWPFTYLKLQPYGTLQINMFIYKYIGHVSRMSPWMDTYRDIYQHLHSDWWWRPRRRRPTWLVTIRRDMWHLDWTGWHSNFQSLLLTVHCGRECMLLMMMMMINMRILTHKLVSSAPNWIWTSETEMIPVSRQLHVLATSTPKAMTAGNVNDEGDDHGKNPCTIAWAWRAVNTPATPKVMTTGKTAATPKITFFANC